MASLLAGSATNRGTLRYDIVPLPMEEVHAINDRGEVVGTDARGALKWTPKGVARLKLWPGLPPGTIHPEDINDHGAVVGHIDTNEAGAITVFAYHAFHWFRGEMREIRGRFDEYSAPAPENDWTGVINGAYSINNRGDVLGLEQGFVLWRRDSLFKRKPLKLPFYARRSLRERACDLNDLGQVAGTKTISIPDEEERELDVTRAVFWDSGKTLELGTLGGKSSRARRLNNRATVVGWSHGGDGRPHAFMWRVDKLTALRELPGMVGSVAAAINDFDEAVGWCWDASHSRAVLWRNGRVHELHRLLPVEKGVTFDSAVGINNRGQIIVNGERNQSPRAFLFTPTKGPR